MLEIHGLVKTIFDVGRRKYRIAKIMIFHHLASIEVKIIDIYL